MATLLLILLVVGYAWSVWSLKRQEHFDEGPVVRRPDTMVWRHSSRTLRTASR